MVTLKSFLLLKKNKSTTNRVYFWGLELLFHGIFIKTYASSCNLCGKVVLSFENNLFLRQKEVVVQTSLNFDRQTLGKGPVPPPAQSLNDH